MELNLPNDIEKQIIYADELCKEVGYFRVEKSADITFEDGEKADVSIITSNDIDRDGDIIQMGGLDWSDFEKTGSPVLFNHDWKQLPVGKSLWTKKTSKGWVSKTKYIDKPSDYVGNWFPDVKYHYVKKGMLNGKSIGLLTTKVERPSVDEMKARPELKDVRYIIKKAKVLEYSVVALPANKEAVVQAINKSMTMVEEVGILVPENIAEIIKKEFAQSKWNIMEEVQKLDLRQMIKDAIELARGRV